MLMMLLPARALLLLFDVTLLRDVVWRYALLICYSLITPRFLPMPPRHFSFTTRLRCFADIRSRRRRFAYLRRRDVSVATLPCHVHDTKIHYDAADTPYSCTLSLRYGADAIRYARCRHAATLRHTCRCLPLLTTFADAAFARHVTRAAVDIAAASWLMVILPRY